MENGKKSPQTIQSIQRSLDILEFLVEHGSGQKLVSIAEACGLNKATAFHIIKTLELRGYIEQSPDSLKYKLGGKLFELATKSYQRIDMNKICEPYMAEFIDRFNETIAVYNYAAIHGEMKALCTDFKESSLPVRVLLSTGKWLRLYASAPGRLYLSAYDDRRLDEYFDALGPLEKITAQTITQRTVLLEKIAACRQDRYCVEQEEYEPGVVNLAVPIYKYSGRVIASLCVTLPSQRAEAARLQQMAEFLLPASKELSDMDL
ncbi:MAG: IclR family transcriptional regulator [Lachnospiraceae bacterium]|jgi:IclR family KDG regulon transcriptional repressor|nr:IclR family transcriptional regulator [Lachnospiraceae bacterium]